MLKIAVFGAAGRMGRTLIRALGEAADMTLSGALVSPGSQFSGDDAGRFVAAAPIGIRATDQPERALSNADVVIDFSCATAVLANIDACVHATCPLVIGTTGLNPEQQRALAECAKRIAVLHAPNTSIGMNWLCRLAERSAAALGPGYDVEIHEAHHRHKTDAPSGSALRLGESIASARGVRLEEVAESGARDGPRRSGEIGFSVLRAGDIVGEHTVIFAGRGERIELTHRVSDRMTFASGALDAARWLAGRAPGLYGMSDVLAH